MPAVRPAVRLAVRLVVLQVALQVARPLLEAGPQAVAAMLVLEAIPMKVALVVLPT